MENKRYDLEERTAKFGEHIIDFCRDIKTNPISSPLINQVVRSATSIGANYMEANGASSKKDFRNKIYICKKEAQETSHWLRMILKYLPDKDGEIKIINSELQELILIFGKIISALDNRNSKLEIQN